MSPQPNPALQGALFGLSAAALFGASMPLAKLLLSNTQPFVLAGLFYLGSGIGLTIWQIVVAKRRNPAAKQASLAGGDWAWLAAAVFFGGICAGMLLMWGLQKTPASDASLLLNLEGTFAALIAWTIFKEHAGLRVVLGMILLTAGAMLISTGGQFSLHFSPSAICIVLACLCWGIDNNLTRKISAADPVQITAIKGLVAGVINILIGLSLGGALPTAMLAGAAMSVGFFAYGVSLVLYIFGLRYAGAARTSAYFSAAPFIGAAASIVILQEPVSPTFLTAGALMATGLWLHLTEDHDHVHTHEPLEHEHPHVHDEHHQHPHEPGDPTGEPHTHKHRHEPITHGHPHMPDIHHLHTHD
jgi:drug/metabolite transporter (DMT)-like permease